MTIMKKYIFLSILVALSSVSSAQLKRSVLLKNGTAHLGTGDVINHSVIGMMDGKLTLVADALITTVNEKDYDTVINIEGKHVYPGFIVANVSLGLIEIEAVRATADFRETGGYNPNARTLIAYNTDSKVIPTVRNNGVLIAHVCPRGGVVSGTSSLMNLSGWNWEDAALLADDGIHINWPQYLQTTGWWAEPGETRVNERYMERYNEIKKFFTEAKAYYEQKEKTETDLRFESMKGLFSGEKNLFIHADYVRQMTDAIVFFREMNIKNIVIIGGYDSWMITETLKENKVSVMLRRLHELPVRPEDPIDLPFRIPYLLQQAGVLYCLENSGDQEAAQSRNLPFLAGTAVGFGLTKEQALMSVTLNAAKILRIDHRVGSLQVGKDATLFVSDGDALDIRTNNVTHIWIAGEWIAVNDHQRELYMKYCEKYSLKCKL
jgi:imidazolonepropionase-like amidohydrolase